MNDDKRNLFLAALLQMTPNALAGLALAMMQVAYEGDEIKIEEIILRFRNVKQPTVN